MKTRGCFDYIIRLQQGIQGAECIEIVFFAVINVIFWTK